MLAPAITNALTIDVEDYFQVSAFAPYIRRDEWDRRECRVERNVQRILALLAERGTQATFFTLGWVAERYPALVRDIVAGGHELASHGYGHERASDLDRAAFRDDIARAKALLEDTGGVAVKGYRAPSFSIGRGNLWALEVLARGRPPLQLQHLPDQARPLRHARRAALRLPHGEGLLEVPVTTLRLFEPQPAFQRRRLLPAAALCRVALDAAPGQPASASRRSSTSTPGRSTPASRAIAGIDAKTRFRHYVNSSATRTLPGCWPTSAGAAWTTYFSTGTRQLRKLHSPAPPDCGVIARCADRRNASPR
jgi:polysaccharide deacetylase family protein (PEP-CTERM system associated)